MPPGHRIGLSRQVDKTYITLPEYQRHRDIDSFHFQICLCDRQLLTLYGRYLRKHCVGNGMVDKGTERNPTIKKFPNRAKIATWKLYTLKIDF